MGAADHGVEVKVGDVELGSEPLSVDAMIKDLFKAIGGLAALGLWSVGHLGSEGHAWVAHEQQLREE